MKLLNETSLNANYANYIVALTDIIGSEIADKISEELCDKIKNAPSAISLDTGLAYDGAYIRHTSKILDRAKKINQVFDEKLRVDEISITKVVLLHQLSKALMFEENDVDWQIKKGDIYKYTELTGALRCGERSIWLCAKYGIYLTEEETEAMRVIDKDFAEDTYVKYYGSTLSLIIKMANDVANVEAKTLYKLNKKK